MIPTPDAGQQTRDRLLVATVAVIIERGWGRHHQGGSPSEPECGPVWSTTTSPLSTAAAGGRARHVRPRETGPFLRLIDTMSSRRIVEAVVGASLGRFAPDAEVETLLYECMLSTSRDGELRSGLQTLLERFRHAIAARIRACHPEP